MVQRDFYKSASIYNLGWPEWKKHDNIWAYKNMWYIDDEFIFHTLYKEMKWNKWYVQKNRLMRLCYR